MMLPPNLVWQLSSFPLEVVTNCTMEIRDIMWGSDSIDKGMIDLQVPGYANHSIANNKGTERNWNWSARGNQQFLSFY